MRITKTDIPAKIDVPGALARQAVDFGDASACGSLSAARRCRAAVGTTISIPGSYSSPFART